MTKSLGLDYLNPLEPIGLLILILGIFFTMTIIYIFLNLENETIDERNRKKNEKIVQEKKIQRLYPPKDKNK